MPPRKLPRRVRISHVRSRIGVGAATYAARRG
jgi:hypothetical protein